MATSNNVKVVLFFPFDLGLELDFAGKKTQEFVHEISSQGLPILSFQGKLFPHGRMESHLYRFGVGLIKISFWMEYDLNSCADMACNAEKITVGKVLISDWCQSLISEMIEKAQKFAAHRYDLRLKDNDIFPVFVFNPEQVGNADLFIRENYKALYGIVSGEPHFDRLSDFVFQKEPLGNFGYYENEVILLKRFGAVASSSESAVVLDLIALGYAQYWSIKSYHYYMDNEMSNAQKLLENLPPYYKFWSIPSRYQQFSREAIDFGKDKLSIIDSLYNISTDSPRIDNDWHLRTLNKSIAKVFNVEELYRTLETKLTRVEDSYNQAREFLSTNFFILLDIIFFLWLAWGIVDTLLLLSIARNS